MRACMSEMHERATGGPSSCSPPHTHDGSVEHIFSVAYIQCSIYGRNSVAYMSEIRASIYERDTSENSI